MQTQKNVPIQSGSIRGVRFSEIAVIVRGDDELATVSIADLIDLHRVLEGLIQEPKAAAVKVETLPAPAARQPRERRQSVPVTPVPGALWRHVQSFLRDANRARSFNSILRLAERLPDVGDNPYHSLKVLLGRRTSSGDIQVTKSGRYRLA